MPEVFFLFMKIRRAVIAHEREEGGDSESLIAIADDLIVDCVLILPEG